MTARFAPVRADGLRAWVRESSHFGRTTHTIVWAETAAEARHASARMHLERIRVRRATVADVEAHS